MTRLIRPSGHCATRTSDGAMRARAGPQPSTAAVQVPASPVERSIAWLIPRLRIEGWHRFSTLVGLSQNFYRKPQCRQTCNPALFAFPPVEGRAVVASFDGGAITSDAGALLLGQTDCALRLTERFAACFADTRTAGLVEHQVETLVMQHVVGIALGYART